jgi:pimeloyl-ACP methyl ester carboxylesterase
MDEYPRKLRKNELLLLLSVALSAALVSCASTKPIRDSKGRPLPGSVALIERVRLGGVPQFVCARGRSADNPILLVLHGGPGSAMTPMFVHYNRALENDFIVVNWDQRGAGKSYSRKIQKESMTVDRFVEDAHELVVWLKARFGKEKIYLLGHSWGSVLGTLLVNRYPGDFIAYAGTGQFVNGRDNELDSYRFTLSEAERLGKKTAIRELKKIGPPVDGLYSGGLNSFSVQRKWLKAFRGSVYSKKGMYGLVMPALFNTTEYSGINIFDYLNGIQTSTKTMWPEVVKIDLEAAAPEWEVPAYFLMGRHDWNTPHELAAAYFERLKAPTKTLIWFENSGHWPSMEEPAAFNEAILRMLRETR